MDNWLNDVNEEEENEVRDFNYGGKDALIFLIDSTEKMHVKDDEDEESPFEKALKAVNAVMKKKIIQSPNDLIGVLLFGTEQSIDDFQHLSVLSPLDVPEAEIILKTENQDFDFGSDDNFSLHEALWQCQSMFANANKGKLGSKKILLLTCNDDPHNDKPQKKRQSMTKAKDLYENGIKLELLPIINQGQSFKVDKFYSDLIKLAVDDDNDELDDEEFSVRAVDNYDELLRQVRKRVHKKRSVGKINFELGPNLKFSVSTYNFIQKAYKVRYLMYGIPFDHSIIPL